jgi:Flp pilus assembly protein TadD, contains TPR repeats
LLAHIEYPANLKQHPHDFWVEDWESRRVIDYSETYSQLGNLLATYGKFEDARRAYEKSLEIFPDHFGSLKNLTIVYANLGDPEKSNEMWMEVYKRNPNDEDAKRYLQGLGKIPRDTE